VGVPLNMVKAQDGSLQNRRIGLMDANLVSTRYKNTGEVTDYPNEPAANWPEYGRHYIDGLTLIVSVETLNRDGMIIHPMETQYREFTDNSPEGVPWGFEPLPGYFNQFQDQPARSDMPETWPSFWPDKPDSWNGYWNSYFGRGVNNPFIDLETYYVMDDDPDEEPNYSMNFYCDESDLSRGGVGLEVKVRAMQSSQSALEDIVFFLYEITNESTTDYDKAYTSFYIDWAVGGVEDGADDIGEYDTELDIAFAYDTDGYGTPGNWFPVGYAGLAFLESPGMSEDGIDNDIDGIVDEKRFSDGPGTWLDVYPYGFNSSDWETFTDIYLREPTAHWANDEDCDWSGFTDMNSNNIWDIGEPLNDDLGADGVGPLNVHYVGPDIGEGDGLPTDGEPNYNATDPDESDQIGLTGFEIFPVHEYELTNDEQNWEVFTRALVPVNELLQHNNLGMFVSSGPFAIRAGESIHYATALVFGEDREDLFRNKRVAQQFYNSHFSLPDSLRNLSALFLADRNIGGPPLEVQFTDHSITNGLDDIISWIWGFGDSSTSVLQNPTHTYSEAGIYDVTLTVIDQSSGISQKNSEALINVEQFSQEQEGNIVEDKMLSCSANWVDYNNDGLLDLFVANGALHNFGLRPGQRNSLYKNEGDNSFSKITTGAIVNDSTKSSSSCWGDFDNDGHIDLFVANGNDVDEENNCLFRNNGDETFTKITEGNIVSDGGKSYDCSWVDYNQDGYIDLFVANYGYNFLYENNGDGTFTANLESPIVADLSNSKSCAWSDYDNDGDLDLFVANDGPNDFYINNGDGSFSKVVEGHFVTNESNSNSCTWGDYNNDLFLDLYVANGHYIYTENNFLYINNGNGTFTALEADSVVSDIDNSIDASWDDYDNDGDLDLIVINSLSFPPMSMGNVSLYRNNSDNSFTRMPPEMTLAGEGSSILTSSSWADINRDGYSDAVVTNIMNNGLYHNRGTQHSWIEINCIGMVSNTSAIGTKIKIKAFINGNYVWQTREISGQNGSTLNARFGLSDATIIDSLEVLWPFGEIQSETGLMTNQFLYAQEGGEIVGFNENGNPTISYVYPGDTDNDGDIDAEDILPIGVFFLEAGDSRDSASMVWEPQEMLSWSTFPANYADANGDGIVDEKDVIPIGVNWGREHEQGSSDYVINQNDQQRLNDHREAFEKLFTSIQSLESPAGRAMKAILETILHNQIPSTFRLAQNYPNPFNPSTQLDYFLPKNQNVSLQVYNIKGQLVQELVKDAHHEAGVYSYTIDGSGWSSGLYFLEFKSEDFHAVNKMILIK